MIPKVIPPLTGLSVLVTRPVPQADALCKRIEELGGIGIRFPAIAIEPQSAPPADPCDLAVFVSVNAVEHGRYLIAPDASTKIAAIGKATAAALKEAGFRVDYVPEAGFTSEALLAVPNLELAPGMRALIVRGEGGREVLQSELAARGLTVQTREVYKRVRPPIDVAARDALEEQWSDDGVDVVLLTSVTTLHHLREMLSDRGNSLLKTTPLLVVSSRIAQAARDADLHGHILVAPAADDASVIGTLAQWHARARD